jgi:homopolymeric O-antigen transport system ATP-binding protein
MGDLVIRAEGLSKRYRIGAHPRAYRTLRESMVDAAGAPLRWAGAAMRGKLRDQASENEIWALRDVWFEVRQGEVLGVIGRNGAGKSTLLKILSKITEPSDGRVRVAGRVGSLLEVGTGFHPELTGRENIFLNGAILGMRRDEILKRFDAIVDFSEVERFIDTPVKHYSSGMYLRLAFAVAAHLDPEILLVDEVLAVGDIRFQQKCLGKMETVGREGRTVLFVSHNMPAILRLCERAILLDEGRVVADGPAQPIVARYLNMDQTVQETTAEVEWPTVGDAPGEDGVRLKALRLRGSAGAPQAEFDVREPIDVEIQFWVLTEAPNVVPMFRVYNEHGVCVFASAPTHDVLFAGRSRAPGTYTARCRIPADFMAEGAYALEIAVRTLFPRRFFVPRVKLLNFRVHDRGMGDSVKGEYRGVWPGTVAPVFDWQSDYSSRIEPAE